MSEQATQRTIDLLQEDFPKVLVGSLAERWDAIIELAAEAKELAHNVDEAAITEIAQANADKHGVEYGAASRVMQSTRRRAGGLAAMHAPSRRVWQGSGSSIATVGAEVVDYFSKPGEVEEKYGPAFPYIIAKLGWAGALVAEGIETQDNRGGYQRVTQELQQRRTLNAGSLQHIGSIAYLGEAQLVENKLSRPFHLASVSGTLPEPWFHAEHGFMPGYKNREAADEAAGLLDNYPQNLRAGLYDVMFGEMVIQYILGNSVEGSTLYLLDPKYYEGVDIN